MLIYSRSTMCTMMCEEVTKKPLAGADEQSAKLFNGLELDQRVQVGPPGIETPPLFQPLNNPEAAEFQLTGPFHNYLLQGGEKNSFNIFIVRNPGAVFLAPRERKPSFYNS